MSYEMSAKEQKKVIEAVKILRKICRSSGRCVNCPFHSRDNFDEFNGCYINKHLPGFWEIDKINPNVVFK